MKTTEGWKGVTKPYAAGRPALFLDIRKLAGRPSPMKIGGEQLIANLMLSSIAYQFYRARAYAGQARAIALCVERSKRNVLSSTPLQIFVDYMLTEGPDKHHGPGHRTSLVALKPTKARA